MNTEQGEIMGTWEEILHTVPEQLAYQYLDEMKL